MGGLSIYARILIYAIIFALGLQPGVFYREKGQTYQNLKADLNELTNVQEFQNSNLLVQEKSTFGVNNSVLAPIGIINTDLSPYAIKERLFLQERLVRKDTKHNVERKRRYNTSSVDSHRGNEEVVYLDETIASNPVQETNINNVHTNTWPVENTQYKGILQDQGLLENEILGSKEVGQEIASQAENVSLSDAVLQQEEPIAVDKTLADVVSSNSILDNTSLDQKINSQVENAPISDPVVQQSEPYAVAQILADEASSDIAEIGGEDIEDVGSSTSESTGYTDGREYNVDIDANDYDTVLDINEDEVGDVGISTNIPGVVGNKEDGKVIKIKDKLVLWQFVVRTDSRIDTVAHKDYIGKLALLGLYRIKEIYFPEIYNRTGKYIYILYFDVNRISYRKEIKKMFKDASIYGVKNMDVIVNFYIKRFIDKTWETEWVLKFYKDTVAKPLSKPQAKTQWHLDYIEAQKAWDSVYNGLISVNGPIIAIPDTGIDLGNENLSGNILNVPYPIEIIDRDGHGTHTASIIGAVDAEYSGISGVVPNADMYPIKVFDDLEGITTSVDVSNAIMNAVNKKADVINLSLGIDGIYTEFKPKLLQEVIDLAWESGTLITASAGNIKGNADEHVPACLNHVLSVAGIDKEGLLWKDAKGGIAGSNSGPSTIIAAPGSDILGYGLDGKILSTNGTSSSSAIVSGIAGLIRYKYPSASPEEIALRVINSADRIITGTTIGIVNARRAVSDAFSVERLSPKFVISGIERYGTDSKPLKPGMSSNIKIYIRNFSPTIDYPVYCELSLRPEDAGYAEVTVQEQVYENLPFLCNVNNDGWFVIRVNRDITGKDKLRFTLTLKDSSYNVIDVVDFEIDVEGAPVFISKL